MKKVMSIILSTFMVCGLVLSLGACKEEEGKKYDVTMKICCKTKYEDGRTRKDPDEWIFTPEISEMRVEREYDGLEHTYYLDSYSLPDHPRFSGEWYSPTGEGPNVFDVSLGKVNQRYDEEDPKYVKERGEYYCYVRAESTSDIWNARTVRLYVTVI